MSLLIKFLKFEKFLKLKSNKNIIQSKMIDRRTVCSRLKYKKEYIKNTKETKNGSLKTKNFFGNLEDK